ncbi:MAG TPA: hypothetical protein PKJ63_07100 [Cyclobacteriaceae bacterium]|nr:hypothetical protein [Cyclobacteriaceae bacterium]
MHRSVRYELLSLEAWLATGKRPDRALLGKIKTEATRIRNALLTGVLLLTDEAHVQRYVRAHHYGAIQLLNKCARSSDAELRTVFLELLDQIETHFSTYLDGEAELSTIHRKMVANICKKIVDRLPEQFTHLQVSVELQQVFVSALKEVADNRKATYHHQWLINVLAKELDQLGKVPDTDTEPTLRLLLLNMNLNSILAFQYWKNYIEHRVNDCELKSDKLEELMKVTEEIDSINPVQATSYLSSSLPLCDQLRNYIGLKIDQLIRHPTALDQAGADDFRVRTALSVSQLACLIKTLIDNRVIVNQNVSELLRFMAQTIVSKRAETISFDSLRAKYYNIESGTRDAVRQTLQALVKKLT